MVVSVPTRSSRGSRGFLKYAVVVRNVLLPLISPFSRALAVSSCLFAVVSACGADVCVSDVMARFSHAELLIYCAFLCCRALLLAEENANINILSALWHVVAILFKK
jgi:hypothetical protein